MHRPKRDSLISITVPEDVREKLTRLAHLSKLTLSTYVYRILVKHSEDKEVAEALGIKLNDK